MNIKQLYYMKSQMTLVKGYSLQEERKMREYLTACRIYNMQKELIPIGKNNN